MTYHQRAQYRRIAAAMRFTTVPPMRPVAAPKGTVSVAVAILAIGMFNSVHQYGGGTAATQPR